MEDEKLLFEDLLRACKTCSKTTQIKLRERERERNSRKREASYEPHNGSRMGSKELI